MTKQDFDLVGKSKPGLDVAPRNRPEILDKFPFGVECKRQNKLNIWDAMRQTKRNIENDRRELIPIIATQCRNLNLMILEEQIFLAMVRVLNENCPGWKDQIIPEKEE